MKIDKRYLSAIAIGAIIATAGVVGVQARAQNNTSAPVTAAPADTTSTAATTDTDNIQDPGGVEQVDQASTAQSSQSQADDQKDGETNDDQSK